MIKIRLTYADDKEKDIAMKKIKENFEVLNISREYKGRGSSQYSNVYIDVNNLEKNNVKYTITNNEEDFIIENEDIIEYNVDEK